jgi:hypothetical protein
MTKTIEVEIDDSGMVRPTDPAASLPHGRALLVWQTEPVFQNNLETMPLSEALLAVDWLSRKRTRHGRICSRTGSLPPLYRFDFTHPPFLHYQSTLQ